MRYWTGENLLSGVSPRALENHADGTQSHSVEKFGQRHPVGVGELSQRARSRVEGAPLDLLEVREGDVVVLHDVHEREAASLPEPPAGFPESLLEVGVRRHGPGS